MTRSMVVLSLFFGLATIDGGLSVAAEGSKKPKAYEFFATYGFDPEIPGIHAADNKVLKDNVIKRFGQPANVEVATGSDRDNPGSTIEFDRLEYPGLRITLMRRGAAQEGEYEITQIVVTSSQYRLKYGLGIGQPKEAFLKVLGPPPGGSHYRSGIEYTGYLFKKDSGEEYRVSFQFDDDRATSIAWDQLGDED